jgi:O-antigen ligase
MKSILTQATPFQKIYSSAPNVSIPTYFIAGILTLLFFGFTALFNMPLYVFIVVVSLPIFWMMVNYPRTWIYAVILGFVVFMKMDEEGISFSDIFAAVLYNSFLIFWFIARLLVKSDVSANVAFSNNHFRITSVVDKLFLTFYALLLFNVIIALTNGIELFDWLREYMLYSLILFYFPLREYFAERKYIYILLLLFGLVVIALDIRQFYSYYEILGNVKYAYQIASSVRDNQQVFSCSLISAITFFFYANTRRAKLFALVVSLFSAAAIISTFSRAFWTALMAMVLVLFIFLNYKQILQFILIIALATGIILISINTLFPHQASFVTKYIGKRFTSTSNVKKDISVESRLREYEIVLGEIKDSPIWGHGFRKQFSFYNNIMHATHTTSFTHNGYFNLSHKAGIPMCALFYLAMGLTTIKGFFVGLRLNRHCRSNLDGCEKYKIYTAMAISGTLSIIMLLIVNSVTSSFIFRDGLMVTAFAIAFIHIASKKYDEVKNLYSQSRLLPE